MICFREADLKQPPYKKGSPEPLPKNFQERECWRGVIWSASVKHGLKRQPYKKGSPEPFFFFLKRIISQSDFRFCF